MSIELVMLSNHFLLCCPLLLLSSVFPGIRVFPNESSLCIRWPEYLSFSINLSNEYSWLISFRIEWFDLLSVQGTPKSLLQYHNLKASVLLHSAFFMVQLSKPYMTAGKIIVLTIWTFVGKSMSLLFNTLFISRSKHLLIFMAAVTICSNFGAQENKIYHCFHFFLSICHKVMGLDAMILAFWMLSFKPDFSLSSFTFIKRLSSSTLHFAFSLVSSAYLRLLIFLLATLTPACDSFSSALCMMYSA